MANTAAVAVASSWNTIVEVSSVVGCPTSINLSHDVIININNNIKTKPPPEGDKGQYCWRLQARHKKEYNIK
jgi:hypothetical protein